MSEVIEEQEKAVGSDDEGKQPQESASHSKCLKAIVDFDEEEQDINTELFKSTIRTTPLDSDGDPLGVDELLLPDGLNESEKDSKESQKIEKEALEVANESGDESEEELEGYTGNVKKEDDDWTIVRCSSVDLEDTNLEKGGEQVKEGNKIEEPGETYSMDKETGSDKILQEENGNDTTFEIIDVKMVDDIENEEKEVGVKGHKEGEGDSGNGDMSQEVTEGEKKRASQEVKVDDDMECEVTLDTDKTKDDKEHNEEEVNVDLIDAMKDAVKKEEDESPSTTKDMEALSPTIKDMEPLSPTTKEMDDGAEDEDMEVKDNVIEEKDEDKPEGDKHEKQVTDDATDSGKDDTKTTSDFDDIQVGTRLDTHLQKSRARLGKTGALAQRRKPPRSSWYVEEGQDLEKFRFTDSTQPKPLKKVKEEEETRQPPAPAPRPAARRPPGGMGGPLLMPGLGQLGKVKLKKTNNLEPRARSPPLSTAKPIGHKVFPIPSKRPPTHSKGKAPPAPQSPLSPIESKSNKPPSKDTKPISSKDKPHPLSPKGFKLPSPVDLKPVLRPKPKPRPQSIAASSSPSKDDPLYSKTSEDEKKSNDDVLNTNAASSRKSTTPLWSLDKNKKLPPISSPTNKEPDSPTIPKWKQELLKKKKEAEALEPQPDTEDSSIKKTVIPPPLPKKGSPDTNKSPFTTVPQWQLDLAEKNRKKKEKDEVDLGSRPAKERKTEDSNKIETKKPPLTPKPAIIPRKKFDAIPPEIDSTPAWKKSLQERRQKNEKNLLIETNGEKKDTEKLAVIPSPTKKADLITSPGYRTNVPLWKLELERMKSPLAQRFNQQE